MGPLSQVLGMLPGMSQQLKGVEVDDRDVAGWRRSSAR